VSMTVRYRRVLCGFGLITNKYEVAMSFEWICNEFKCRVESTYLRPRFCKVLPVSWDTACSPPRGWFEIVIVDGFASGAVSNIYITVRDLSYKSRKSSVKRTLVTNFEMSAAGENSKRKFPSLDLILIS
jgi:hypothetical protein